MNDEERASKRLSVGLLGNESGEYTRDPVKHEEDGDGETISLISATQSSDDVDSGDKSPPKPPCCDWSELGTSEDWLACWSGFFITGVCAILTWLKVDASVLSVSTWNTKAAPEHVYAIAVPFVLTFVLIVPLMCSSHVKTTGASMCGYVKAMFSSVCVGAAISTLIGTFSHLKENGLGAALWGVLLGLVMGNLLDYCGGKFGARCLKAFTPGCKKGKFFIKIPPSPPSLLASRPLPPSIPPHPLSNASSTSPFHSQPPHAFMC
jgi:hypothetical protein